MCTLSNLPCRRCVCLPTHHLLSVGVAGCQPAGHKAVWMSTDEDVDEHISQDAALLTGNLV
jgi:hypothetical protein